MQYLGNRRAASYITSTALHFTALYLQTSSKTNTMVVLELSKVITPYLPIYKLYTISKTYTFVLLELTKVYLGISTDGQRNKTKFAEYSKQLTNICKGESVENGL